MYITVCGQLGLNEGGVVGCVHRADRTKTRSNPWASGVKTPFASTF